VKDFATIQSMKTTIPGTPDLDGEDDAENQFSNLRFSKRGG
jgi:hypothetical protein